VGLSVSDLQQVLFGLQRRPQLSDGPLFLLLLPLPLVLTLSEQLFSLLQS